MDMEDSPQEFTGSNDHHHHHGHVLIKGKRTKRQRPSSPVSVPAITTSSSDGCGGDKFSVPSPMVSSEEMTYESTTEEEEDMANCLILLAQSGSGNGGGGCGGGKRRNEGCDGNGSEKTNTRKFTDRAAAAAAGLYGYECKTCNRTFPSFQALGGHRASHKKPKTTMTEEKKSLVTPRTPPPLEYDRYYDDQQKKLINKITIVPSFTTTTLSLLHGTNHQNKSSSKVHECSICGSEFSSGQALGGHMRRHRTLTSAQIINTTMINMDTTSPNDHHQTHEVERRRNILPLDLNLPAPDDDRDTKFQFTAPSNQSHILFSSPALVDCHY